VRARRATWSELEVAPVAEGLNPGRGDVRRLAAARPGDGRGHPITPVRFPPGLDLLDRLGEKAGQGEQIEVKLKLAAEESAVPCWLGRRWTGGLKIRRGAESTGKGAAAIGVKRLLSSYRTRSNCTIFHPPAPGGWTIRTPGGWLYCYRYLFETLFDSRHRRESRGKPSRQPRPPTLGVGG